MGNPPERRRHRPAGRSRPPAASARADAAETGEPERARAPRGPACTAGPWASAASPDTGSGGRQAPRGAADPRS
eukprot:2547851-Alexandrium_andersonii.AAC.1